MARPAAHAEFTTEEAEGNMSGIEIAVALGVLSGIAWVNWYFFFAERQAHVALAGAGGIQELTVRVNGGYEPSVLQVRRGAPVRITFDRQEDSSCSEEVVFSDFGIRRFLPAHERTTIELTPEKTGSFAFTCGMSMLRGRLIVTEKEGSS